MRGLPDPDDLRGHARVMVAEFRDKDLLLYASGLGLRVLIAIIPVALFVVALLGFFGLEDIWADEGAPALRENVSPAVFTVIDDAVNRVLGRENGYWLSIGAAVALISMASIVKGVTETLNRLHGIDDSRPLAERIGNSLLVGAATAALALAALAVVRLGPLALDDVIGGGPAAEAVGFGLRWTVAIALLLVLMVLLKRVPPDLERPLDGLALGSAITVLGWFLASVLFGAYLEYVASYDSVFGNLATVYVAVQYVALSAVVYVAGLVVDRLVAREWTG